MQNKKLTKSELMRDLEAIIFTMRPFEMIKIKKDEFGRANRIVVMTESTTILDYDLTE